MMTKKSYLYDRFFVSNQNVTTEHVKNVQNSRFFGENSRFSRFFSKFLQFQVFPGKVATLIVPKICTPIKLSIYILKLSFSFVNISNNYNQTVKYMNKLLKV